MREMWTNVLVDGMRQRRITSMEDKGKVEENCGCFENALKDLQFSLIETNAPESFSLY
jgi:hypothetical protein